MKNNYNIRNELLKDSRFYIDEFNMNRILGSNIKVTAYEYVSIPVSKIYMEMENSLLQIEQTIPYCYLSDNDSGRDTYINYCKKYGSHNPNRSIGAYDDLINNMSYKEYDPTKGVIVINQYGIILDGQHRVCLIQKKHGKDYHIPVLKLYFNYTLYRKVQYLIKYFKMKKV